MSKLVLCSIVLTALSCATAPPLAPLPTQPVAADTPKDIATGSVSAKELNVTLPAPWLEEVEHDAADGVRTWRNPITGATLLVRAYRNTSVDDVSESLLQKLRIRNADVGESGFFLDGITFRWTDAGDAGFACVRSWPGKGSLTVMFNGLWKPEHDEAMLEDARAACVDGWK